LKDTEIIADKTAPRGKVILLLFSILLFSTRPFSEKERTCLYIEQLSRFRKEKRIGRRRRLKEELEKTKKKN